ncbi:netrin receptor unc-5-like [Anopheles darlingi]|uniref:netrin receptor unc-5-like n=1 Tax=Anopheles darlingi TaxID=43151 RepID=UPI0021001FAD|nr:netrin receptor unc-5-like [Anopheles darlingi]
MKILCKLSHFLNLFFIAGPLLGPVAVAGEERVDLKNLAQNTSHSSRFATSSGGGGGHERVLPFHHDSSAVVVSEKDKSQPQAHRSRKHQLEFDDFEGFGSSGGPRRSSQTQRTALNQSRDTVRTKDRRKTNHRHETFFPFGDDGEVGKDPKSENNQAEMKVFHPRRASGAVTTGKEQESVSRDATGDDVVDAAKEDDYYDTVAAGVDDNYEDEKIIKPASSSSSSSSATLDSFFDGSRADTSSARAFENRNGVPKAVDDGLKNGASIHGVHGDRDEQDSNADDEDDDDDEDEDDDEEEEDGEASYGEDVLPPSEAFGTFGGRSGDGLKVEEAPYFLVEPQSTYVIRSKPAVLKCKAANTLQIHFKCSGSIKPPPSVEESHVDPHSGVHFQEVTATISRDLVYEYFGKLPFKCECHAWSPRGKAVSQPASIVVAYLKKHFDLAETKIRAEAGEKLEIKCVAPKGYPKPQITWQKNNFNITASPLLTFTTDGNIVITSVSLQDIGNYTCVAENIAGKRTSEPIELVVYVNGGWSQWSAWLECRCPGKAAQGRKRTRTCSDPIPLYGGAPCVGPNQQKTADCVTCPEDTQIITPNGFEDNTLVRRWSSWSSWSSCTSKCTQSRRRVCRTQGIDYYDKALVKHHQQLAALMEDHDEQDSSAYGCHGKDLQTIVCRGGECKIDDTASDWIFYLGLGFIVTLCLTFLVFLLHIRHRQKIPTYSITRTSPDQHTYTHEFQKKLTHSSNAPDINIRVNGYEYSNGSTMEAPKMPSQNVPLLLTRSVSEHHYDEPQFASMQTMQVASKKDETSNIYSQQKQAGTVSHPHHYHQYHAVPEQQNHLQRQMASPAIQSQKGQYRSTESLSAASNTNTSNSTYAIATTDSLDTSSSNEAMYKSNSARQVVTGDGGWLELEHLQTSLSIPEGAIPAALKINVFLAVMYDSKDTILVENQVTHISPTVVCGPAKSNFSKPLIIKVPHCAEDITGWKVSLFYKEEVTNCWKKIASSENDVPSPQAYIQLDPHSAYIMTRKLGKYILGGESLVPEVAVTKRLKIVMFGPARKPETDFNIRAYVLEDYPSALEHCTAIEARLGYFQIGQSSAFHFANSKEAMTLRINCSGGWTTVADCAVQKIPFNHIWKNMSILHCEFLLQKLISEMPCLRLELSAEQENGTKVLITSVAFS